MFETVINLKPEPDWRKGMTIEKLKDEMNDALTIPGVANSFTMPIKARIDMLATGIRTPVGVKVLGPNLEVIENISRDIEDAVRIVPGTRSAYAERVTTGYFLDIKPVMSSESGVMSSEAEVRNTSYCIHNIYSYLSEYKVFYKDSDSPPCSAFFTCRLFLEKNGKLNSINDLKESVMYGAVKRIRPKIMTVSVILAGLIPIMFSHGTGADVMKRIAAPMVGGVITSTILELIIYHVIYIIWKGREIKKI